MENKKVAEVETTPVTKPFHFRFDADDSGLVSVSFLKDAGKLHWVLLELATHINGSFSIPFPTNGDFFRHLADVADDYDRMINERTIKQDDGQRAAEEVREEETGIGLCPADGDLRAECNQGTVPQSAQ